MSWLLCSAFQGVLPKQLLQNVIDIVNEKMDGDEEVVYGEFIWWIGIWVLMSTVDGVDRHSFWSTKNVDAFDGAPFHLTPFMYGNQLFASWINCIDELMSKWINEYTCPGFMYVPRKPWKFGNEYHDAGCADSNIIWVLDLREGKDWPQNLGHKEFDNIGKTTGILL